MRMSDAERHAYRRAQDVARHALVAIEAEITASAIEAKLASACRSLMDGAGATGYSKETPTFRATRRLVPTE
jgi:hypothetical protein